MPYAQRFEDLIAWQKARELTRTVYLVTQKDKFLQDQSLVDQMRRAAVSIMSNIAEGYERRSRGDFRRFLLIAKSSCAELRSQLYIALDVGYVETSTFDSIMKQAVEVAQIIGGLHKSIE